MKIRKFAAPSLCLAVALTAGQPAWGQDVPPAPPTVWNFLGIPQGVNKVRDAVTNRRGNFPGLERKPPLKAIADPANLKSDIPALKAAAEIKQAEDLKKQKIKAIKYLASIGCGCYDKDKKITTALMASMDDCTEEVRLAAVEAITEAAENKECAQCHSNCCCGKEITEKLSKIAYERDDTGCFLEPSERVRAAAIEALAACCPNRLPLEEVQPLPVDPERIPPEVVPDSSLEGQPSGPPPIPSPSDVPTDASASLRGSAHGNARLVSSRRRHQARLISEAPASAPQRRAATENKLQPSNVSAEFELTSPPTQDIGTEPEEFHAPAGGDQQATGQRSSRRTAKALLREVSHQTQSEAAAPSPANVVEVAQGHVQSVDLNKGLVTVHLHDQTKLRQGGKIKVYHQYLTGRSVLTVLEVVESSPGMVVARGVEAGKLSKITRGDEVIGW